MNSAHVGAAAASALLCAFFFFDIHFMSTPPELVALAAAVLVVGFALHAAYAKATAEEARRSGAEASAWFGIFQTNFWFFLVFASLAGGLLPQIESSAIPMWGVVHALGSMLPAAAVVTLSGRTGLF